MYTLLIVGMVLATTRGIIELTSTVGRRRGSQEFGLGKYLDAAQSLPVQNQGRNHGIL